MIPSKSAYLNILKKELNNSANSAELLQEINLHLTELLEDITSSTNKKEEEAMAELIERVGTPSELASLYMEELQITPKKTQWTFISVNLLFFIFGITLTAIYHLVSFPFANQVWTFLTSFPSLIMILYMLFWGLLGYEIGKEFGFSGKNLLYKTFYITLVPNLLLMGLVVFRIIPLGWFDPLLTQPFIVACILCTIILYPISYAGYRWGIIHSV
ncbi:hypothetical protein ACERII_25010 [Evansella sp. AB-rgal1]|uniref:hypothetical protein n=1 Tax=Evansella sp. AB-rgal1 TaxID=3242696 RepID=UPI00359E4B70